MEDFSTVRISELPDATNLIETNLLVVEQADATKKSSWIDIFKELGISRGITFTKGGTLVLQSDVAIDTRDGKVYKWYGTYPKTIDPDTVGPETSGGIGPDAWVELIDTKNSIPSKYLVKTDLKNLLEQFPNYSAQDTKSSYTNDALDENVWYFNGGNFSKGPMVIPEILSEVQFRLFDLSTTPNSFIPYKLISSNYWNIPVQGIEATMHQTAVAPNPFRCTETYGSGATKFLYDGKDTAHGLMRGSLKMLVRISTESKEQSRLRGAIPAKAPKIWMFLATPDATPTPEAQNRYALSINNNWHDIPTFKLWNRASGMSLPYKSWDDYQTLLASEPLIDHTNVTGRIDSNSVSPDLVDTSGTGLTTNWITVGGETVWVMNPVGGESSAMRIQFKDKAGVIFYDSQQSSGTTSAKQVIMIHPDAVQMRVYFKNNGDTCTDLEIKAVPMSLDPFYGLWAEYDFNVNQMVTFEPGYVYSFTMQFFDSVDTQHDSNGFAIVSGGLSFLRNVRDTMQTNIVNMME